MNLKTLISKLILLLFILIFVMSFSALFGNDNILIGVAIVTGILMFWNMDIGIRKAEAPLLIAAVFVSIGAFSYIAGLNPVLGFIVHLVSIFVIMLLFSEKVEYKAFLPFMLCYVFAQGIPVADVALRSRLYGLLIGGTLTGIVYYYRHRKTDNHPYPRIWNIIRHVDVHSVRFDYAVKMAAGVSTGMLIGDLFQAQRGMWISLTILSILQPHLTHSKERLKHRLTGTIIGAAVFMILFVMLPSQFSVMITLLLSYMYMFVVEYRIQMIFVTVQALNASLVLFDYPVSIGMRLSFIVIGACIAVLISKYDLKDLRAKLIN
ncbi:FUSC family protein [Paenibacillus dakarensis]|uniref:FUSC family protein n=1 Tax=Paenibacillus dakarensis TaxID=1527293 RepID=UPI0014797F97|nr:FUSC family protein [Paenibacillus dakarensis]